MEKFNTYSFSDFLDDDSFVRFIKYGQKEEQNIWLGWLSTQPANLDAYQDARAYLLTVLSATPVLDTEANKNNVWAKIEQEIITKDRRSVIIRQLRIWSVSAAAVISLFFGVSWYYRSQITVTTGNGQQITVTLPDNSTVKLNANSSLTYFRAWNWHPKREVWLNGEALFEVIHLNQQASHIKRGEQFLAHAGPVNVQVLGTTFNIKNRRSKVSVALINGKVSVQNLANTFAPLIMKPGEAVEYRDNKPYKIPISHMINKPLAWTSKKMILSGMTVTDIIENFEDTYGGRIVLDKPALLNKRIDGTISIRTRESMLYMLANLLNATIEQRDSSYYLKTK